MKFELTVLGNNSAIPAYKRHLSSQVLYMRERLFLIDCGEGTQMQMMQYKIRMQRIERIFISHLHGDHVLGLPGLLMTMSLNQREKELWIYGPEGLAEFIEFSLKTLEGFLTYPLHFVTVNPKEHYCLHQDQDLEIWTLPLEHRMPCSGYLFREKLGTRRMRKEQIEALQIPNDAIMSIKKGADWQDAQGIWHENETLTLPPRAPRSFAYCSDTSFKPELVPWIQGVDLLYHEATFMRGLEEQALQTGHSTAWQAGEIARLAEVRHLLIGHFSARYGDLSPILEEARAVFPHTSLAMEGKVFYVV